MWVVSFIGCPRDMRQTIRGFKLEANAAGNRAAGYAHHSRHDRESPPFGENSGLGMAMRPTLSNLEPLRVFATPKGARWARYGLEDEGKTSGAGNKGQQSCRGYSRRPGFEGGQMPLHRRPKRGFSSPFPKTFAVVNVRNVERVSGGRDGDSGYVDRARNCPSATRWRKDSRQRRT